MAHFKLQFDAREVAAYASRYAYEDDSAVLVIGRKARKRGHYTREEFVAVCRWKTPRSGPLVATKGAAEVEIATRIGLSAASTERERMDALRSLAGVEFPTASVLLHLIVFTFTVLATDPAEADQPGRPRSTRTGSTKEAMMITRIDRFMLRPVPQRVLGWLVDAMIAARCTAIRRAFAE